MERSSTELSHIVIQGAGLIGGFLGGVLAHAGARVTLLGRPRFLEPLGKGLFLKDLQGLSLFVPRTDFRATSDPACLAQADIVFTCVKSGATKAAAAELAAFAPDATLVVSFQNGVANADILKAGAPQCEVLAGMVPFSVMQPAPAHWHRGTEGALYATAHPDLEFLVPMFAAANLTLKFTNDMRGVLWSKVLMNLNNAVNALSGLPLRAELNDRKYRLVLAACIEEALTVLNAVGIVPQQINRTKPAALPGILRWPNFLYANLAMRQLKIDDKARTSMAEDLALSRPTEIDDINGAVVRLGAAHAVATPANEKIIDLVRQAESGDAKRYSGRELCAALGI